MSYSLVPLAENEALYCYEFIHEFLKESRKFGAQRQQSEKVAANIALQNLARNLGFADVLRFSWRIEIRAVIVTESARLLKLPNVEVGDRFVKIEGTRG